MLNQVIHSEGNIVPKVINKENKSEDVDSYNSPSVSSLSASQEFALQQDNADHQNEKDMTGKWVTPPKRRKIESQPYPQTSHLSKYYLGKNKSLPKELKELFTPLKCNLCHCSMGSTVTANDHYEGKKHVSNVKRWLGDHPEYGSQYQIETNQKNTVEFDSLHCKYCNVKLSSEQQAQSHYTGKKHQYMVNSDLMRNGYFNVNTQWERRPEKEKDGRSGIGYIDREATANQRFFCETCQVSCPSLITFNDHLSGAKHKKKMTMLLDLEPPPATRDNILQDVIKNVKRQTSPGDLSIYRTPSGKYYCHSCNVTVNSPIQFLQHSDSRKHKQKSSNKTFK